jgi:hypothetical protein
VRSFGQPRPDFGQTNPVNLVMCGQVGMTGGLALARHP